MYGTYAAVNNVSMTVNRGDIYGFVGANGAGKTTLIRMLCGMAFPTAGRMELFGATNRTALAENRRRLGVIVESPALMRDFTATDCLNWHKTVIGAPKADVKKLLDLVGLGHTGQKKVKDFSLGMRQRLAIAQALTGDPEFLVFDEPANGMDPQGIVEIRELLTKFNREMGITILCSSHILSELDKLATKIGVIHKGRLLDERSRDELSALYGEAYIIKTDKPDRAHTIFKDKGLDSGLRGSFVAVSNFTGKIYELITLLHNNGIEVDSFRREEASLETHYFKMTAAAEEGGLNA